MSFNQYSPLDTTLPFFSNHDTRPGGDTGEEIVLPFLLQLKAVAKRVKITNSSARPLEVFFNNDNSNPSLIEQNETTDVTVTREYKQWITSVKVVFQARGAIGAQGKVEIEYDAVPVQYLPQRHRDF